jgi:small subunit ribosomal protein S5
MAGITDCLSKCTGSTGKLNTVKAVLDGLSQLRTREEIAELRGIEITSSDIEERIERGQRFMPVKSEGTTKMAAPVNTIGQDRGRGGGRGGRGGGRGGRGGPRGGAPAPAAEANAPAEGTAPAENKDS